MPRGYAGKWLDVDLTSGKIDETVFDEEILYEYLGGRGLAAKILWDRLGKKWPNVDPLGPENILTVLTGPLTAIHPGSRVCISGKSPLSNGTVGSTLSTEFPAELRCAGYDGLMITGRASSPVYILVTDNKTEIIDAAHVWGKPSEGTIKILNSEVKKELASRQPNIGLWKEPSLIYIGPAGENRVRTAAVMSKLAHAAGYGGYGGVMGSKNLKAIVAKGRGPLPETAAPRTVTILMRDYHQSLISQDRMRRWGTGYMGWHFGEVTSSEPVRNWQEEWHNARSLAGPRYSARYWVKPYWADFNCSKSCMKISHIRTGPWKGDITDMPDYELEAYCGTNFGIFDPGENIHMSAVIDNLGHSGINGPNTMAFAAELYQRGILTKDDFGFDLKWGDVEAFTKLAWLIAKREKIGDVLAEGTLRAAKKITEMRGVDALKYAVHVKGIEIGAHGTRSDQDFSRDMAYAASVQGGDHTAIARIVGERDGAVFQDSAVVCMFCADPNLIWDFARAVTGWDITRDKWVNEQGTRILTLQRALLLMGGPDIFWDPDTDDDNPARFYEPLPTGPWTGKTTDKNIVQQNKKAYYAALGWDDRGVPTEDTLRKLDLADVDAEMRKLRK
ncbi:aldehyde ferredoxin oxidoreductase [Candidatus Bathyarchaeota archaeon]|jgi:aldehyde:ferredoxin oxidoreductase|nr:aldehyde ferredoxin oxidoreductase [Candidatus Bathyarchaeota archaeon]